MLFVALLSSDGNSNSKVWAISDPYLGLSRCRCLFAKESVDAFSYNIGGSSRLGVWAAWPAGLENVCQLVRGCKMKKSVSAVPTQDELVTTEHLLPSGTFHKSTSRIVGSSRSLLYQYSFSSLPASFQVGLPCFVFEIFGYETPHILKVAPMDPTVRTQNVAPSYFSCLMQAVFVLRPHDGD